MLLPTDFDLIFYAYGRRDAVSLTLEVNKYLSILGADYMPRYLSGKNIVLDADIVAEAFQDWRRDLTLAVGLTSANGLVLKFTVSEENYENVQFPNNMRIGLNWEHITDTSNGLSFDQLYKLFKFCIKLFEPYYAYGSKCGEVNHSNSYWQIFQTIDSDKVPVAIEWFNYFDSEMVDRLGGKEKLLSAPVYIIEPDKELNGLLLVLQKEPFDYLNSEHLKNREVVEDYLDLNRLHALFPRQRKEP
jgi:hypothetical protein